MTIIDNKLNPASGYYTTGHYFKFHIDTVLGGPWQNLKRSPDTKTSKPRSHKIDL